MALLVLGMRGSSAGSPADSSFVARRLPQTRGNSLSQLYAEVTTAADRANKSKPDKQNFMEEVIMCSENGDDCISVR
eukprot:CAMPEP_0172706338 /NCGR_PEP_ID=MMETSP1074-20121228/45939_1 /TAXON_ID=2916 /ORGANISM="Ceratium fusus, Strain PA161109" /LENGTH=76 /DNA_ID=CAMNT_0013528895 /DNA_START=135 /DNA_END=365 /DNA_ORIENTATION=+